MKDRLAYTETITTESGFAVRLEGDIHDSTAEIILRIETRKNCVLHWGLRRNPHAPWQTPPQALWPEGSKAFDTKAVQTPLVDRSGSGEMTFKLDIPARFSLFEFVLFFPEENRWDNNHGRNYRFEIPWEHGSSPLESSLGDPELTGLTREIIDKETGRNSWTLMHRFN